jgi:hypothetical protein
MVPVHLLFGHPVRVFVDLVAVRYCDHDLNLEFPHYGQKLTAETQPSVMDSRPSA